MNLSRLYFSFMVCTLCFLGSQSTEICRLVLRGRSYVKLDYDSNENGIRLIQVEDNGLENDYGMIGRNLGVPTIEADTAFIQLKFPGVDLMVTREFIRNGYVLNIKWTSQTIDKFQDCFYLGAAQWFGGPQQKRQFWPIQKLKLANYSYVTKEADNAAVMEPYWLNSNGMFIYVFKETPLFIDQNNVMDNGLCLIAEIKPPYSSKRKEISMSYAIGFTNNSRLSHEFVVENYFGKPSARPDFKMIKDPIWSTWAEYKRDINESAVREFADNILKYQFNNSQLEIDDKWETCYGSFNVDTKRFPNLKNFTRQLKDLGFRVTVWIHPFINIDCEPWFTEAKQNGYLVKNENGEVETQWWNSEARQASYVDFTNPKAVDWWVGRLKQLQSAYEIDSFKFDAGESSWSPQVPVQTGDIEVHPSHISADYIRACAQFGPLVEVRTAQRSQHLPIFVRMIDKDTEWNFENGLPTLVTTLLQMNLNGYPFVLPDMIGGNGYNEPPSKELFIRWLQANTFMPSLQYSYVPWDYDNETIAISHLYTDLHAGYSGYIDQLFDEAVKKGTPVNMPIWWIDPTDQEAAKIWDEYLLGEYILVAPIVEKGATYRDIYLPKGRWMAEGQVNVVIDGPIWIRNYLAPLHILPYFVRIPDGKNEFERLQIPITL